MTLRHADGVVNPIANKSYTKQGLLITGIDRQFGLLAAVTQPSINFVQVSALQLMK